MNINDQFQMADWVYYIINTVQAVKKLWGIPWIYDWNSLKQHLVMLCHLTQFDDLHETKNLKEE